MNNIYLEILEQFDIKKLNIEPKFFNTPAATCANTLQLYTTYVYIYIYINNTCICTYKYSSARASLLLHSIMKELVSMF